MTTPAHQRASDLVNTHWNGEYCDRGVAIDLIAAALDDEIEACAKVADALHDRELHLTPEERIGDGSPATARTIAAAIRQRKGARHE